MALINCPECGHQMSDTAKRCPNCGYSNFRNNEIIKSIRSNEIIKSIGNHKHYIISGVLGAVSLFIVFFGIGWSTYFSTRPIRINADFTMGLITFLGGIILLFFSCRLLKNKIRYYNKIFYIGSSIYVVSLIITFLCLGFETEKKEYQSYSKKYTTEKTSMGVDEERTEKDTSEENSIVGTYEIIEDRKYRPRRYVLIVNDDGTASMSYKYGNNNEYEMLEYGSWYKYNHMKYAQFKFAESMLEFVFGKGTLDESIIRLRHFVIMDGYLYSDGSAADAKHPNRRVKIKRIQ